MESRKKSQEVKKVPVKREHAPDLNMEDSPPVSDSDVSISCCFSMKTSKEVSGN